MILTDYNDLINQAMTARENSYSPYSTFRVGSAVLCKDGRVYLGCNIENASYGETVCAERVAIFKAISDGNRDFSAIAIVGGINKITDFAFPCGACRQVLCEHCAPDLKIILYNGNETKICTLGELFPHSFGKSDIK